MKWREGKRREGREGIGRERKRKNSKRIGGEEKEESLVKEYENEGNYRKNRDGEGKKNRMTGKDKEN